MDVKQAAATSEQAVEGFMKVEPMIATMSGIFVPGAAPVVAVVQPIVLLAAPFIENALKAIMAGNNGDAIGAFLMLLQHLTPGHRNANALGTDGIPASADPSSQSSG